jgi:NAD+--asparagine ADP-ribosyltransferase
MKKIVLFMVFALASILPISASVTSDTTAIRKFYAEYKVAYQKDLSVQFVTQNNMYSVIKKYCTEDFYNYMESDDVGVDFPTSNYGMDDLSLATLKISAVNNGSYVVTYKVHCELPTGKQLYIQNVKVKITMTKGKINMIESLCKNEY